VESSNLEWLEFETPAFEEFFWKVREIPKEACELLRIQVSVPRRKGNRRI
jgi:hypothetical protein